MELNNLDLRIYQSYGCLKVLFPEETFILGGTCALYLQGLKLREPNDMDIYIIGQSRQAFQNKAKELGIGEPDTPLKIDYQFFDFIDTKPIKIILKDLVINVQPLVEIIRFKQEYLGSWNDKFRSEEHIEKQREDLKKIKSFLKL